MHTYVVNIHLGEIEPIARDFALDEVMSSLGFFPWRPGLPADDDDVGAVFSQWEYAGNHPLEAEALKSILQARIGTEVQGEIDLTVTRVTVKSS